MAEAQPQDGALPSTVTLNEEQGGHTGMPQFNVQVFASQLVWLTITFVLLYVVLSKLLLPRIGRTLTARHDQIESDLGEAARLKQETEAAIAAYDQALAEARARSHAIAAEQRATIMAEVEQRTTTLEQALAERTAAAAESIRATKQRALASVTDIAAEASQAIVEKLLGEKADDTDVRTAVAARLAAE